MFAWNKYKWQIKILINKGEENMKNKNIINVRYLLFLFFVLPLFILLYSCNENSTTSPDQEHSVLSFSEFFFEHGSDIDTSYISMKGIKKNADSLEIQATCWGIIETGPFLSRDNLNKEILFKMMGVCGTINSSTWTKVTRTRWITARETDTLYALSFTNFRDTLRIVKTGML